jgi:Pentapeptide repeats (8 copies)/Pentapeptide repeats (9 copies)
MSCRLSLVCVLIFLGIAPAAHAYSAADLKTLMTTNKCVGCDLSGVDLSSKKLANADLQAANLIGANLTSTNFANANLGGANLTGSNVSNTNFTGAILQAASLVNVNFANTNLTKTDLSYGNLVNTNFKSAILNRTDLSSANLALADFTGANLSSINFSGANLAGTKGVTTPPGRTSDPSSPSNPTIRPGGSRNPAPDRAIPNVDESSSTIMRRPRIYRIPPGLGRPQRLLPGATRQSNPVIFGNE